MPSHAAKHGEKIIVKQHRQTSAKTKTKSISKKIEPKTAIFSDPMVQAQRLVSQKQYMGALQLAATSKTQIHYNLIRWLVAQQPGNPLTMSDYLTLLPRIRDWPNMNKVRLQAEGLLNDATPDSVVLAIFADGQPNTTMGVTRYAQALQNAGRPQEAKQQVQYFYVHSDASSTSLNDLTNRFPGYLGPEFLQARADRLVWEGNYGAARDLLPLLPADSRAKLNVRIALATQSAGAIALVETLSGDAQNDPGVMFERIRWNRKQMNDDAAQRLLAATETVKGYEEPLEKERSLIARDLFQNKNYEGAYKTSIPTQISDSSSYAQNQWFAGWIALRYLKDPDKAETHFHAMYNAVKTPISIARAAYWAGRAEKARGNNEVAEKWWKIATNYPTTFYGQIAARTLNLPLANLWRPDPAYTAQTVTDDSRLQAAQVLSKAGQTDLAIQFLRQAAKTSDADTGIQIAQFAKHIGMLRGAVLAAKEVQQQGQTVYSAGYPLLPASTHSVIDSRLEPALVHGIIRQESEFDLDAKSGAGAMGLMQLMPATAQQTARKLNVAYTPGALLNNAQYNVQLGSRYLADRIDGFESEPLLAIAAYNAGATRVRQWLDQYGDPRSGTIDWIDWLESIPFYETRNYVQRVVENTEVYRMILDQSHKNQ